MGRAVILPMMGKMDGALEKGSIGPLLRTDRSVDFDIVFVCGHIVTADFNDVR